LYNTEHKTQRFIPISIETTAPNAGATTTTAAALAASNLSEGSTQGFTVTSLTVSPNGRLAAVALTISTSVPIQNLDAINAATEISATGSILATERAAVAVYDLPSSKRRKLITRNESEAKVRHPNR
jgi:hypothetical protein